MVGQEKSDQFEQSAVSGSNGDGSGAATALTNQLNNPNLQSTSNGNTSQAADHSSAVLTYLNKRGFSRAEAALRAELEALSNGATPAQAHAAALQLSGPHSVSLKDLAVKNAPRNPNAKDKGKDGAGDDGNLDFGGNNGLDHDMAAAEALSRDPTDRARGFKMLVSWCEGSLDIYQVSESMFETRQIELIREEVGWEGDLPPPPSSQPFWPQFLLGTRARSRMKKS